QGTTEPGSSGSPLMLTATQQIIGQLWGGGASCSDLFAPDFYGRFDKTFPNVEALLTAVNTAAVASITLSASESSGAALINVTLTSNAPPGGYTLVADLTPQSANPGLDYTGSNIAFSIP